jgi:NLR family CARD domain-containing protein 3
MLKQPVKQPDQSPAKHEVKSTAVNKVLTDFIAAIKLGNPSEVKKLDFAWNTIGNSGLGILSNEALATGLCSEGLSIDLSGNEINAMGIEHLAKALESGKCPDKLSINLRNNNIFGKSVQHLVSAIRCGKLPSGLEIDLTGNKLLGKRDVEELTAAVESITTPAEILIIVGKNNITNKPKPSIQSKL